MECPICKKEFDEHTGRRPKKFCSDPCKVKFWNAFKRVQRGEPETKTVDFKPDNDIIRQQIADLVKELSECPKSYSEMGRIIWVKERNKKIQELRGKLR